MNKIVFANPPRTSPPYYFGESINTIEGKINHIQTLLSMFEPVDIFTDNLLIIDSQSQRIVFMTNNEKVVAENEYLKHFEGITCKVLEDATYKLPPNAEGMKSID